jgi:predicted O-methyltransferase YrrM
VLEIGTHIGASTLHIAKALSAVGGGARLTTVDLVDVNDALDGPWKRAGLAMPPRALAEQLGCADVINFVAMRSLDFLRQATDRYDLVFLDGDHRPHALYLEIAAALQVLAPSGLVLLHDYYPRREPLFPDGHVIPGPARAVERIERENPGIAAQPLGVLPWPTKQGVNGTSLALLTRKP